MRKDFLINSVGICFVITHLFTSGKYIRKNDLFNKYIAALFQHFLTEKKEECEKKGYIQNILKN